MLHESNAASPGSVAAPDPMRAAARAVPTAARDVPNAARGVRTSDPIRRPTLRRHERPGFRPDRVAMWAVVLGLFLVLVAVVSAHAAVSSHELAAHALYVLRRP
jgi:hypothetical protein